MPAGLLRTPAVKMKASIGPADVLPMDGHMSGTTALQRIPMSIDNKLRAVLTIAALTHLVEMKRTISQNDKSGFVTFELLEQLVINGSVGERDEVLKKYERHQSFDWSLTAEPV
jgi:hypothetical protein